MESLAHPSRKAISHQVSGVVEHISTINRILQKSAVNRAPCEPRFARSENALGFVSHDLLADMPNFVKVPMPLLSM